MMKTYRGSCHCGSVKYQVNLDLSRGSGRCNCSFCAKVRNWSAITKPEQFEIREGASALGDYQVTAGSPTHHFFCKTCGVRLYTKGFVEEIGGDYVSVTISTIDNLTDEERAEIPVQYMNGRDNDWMHTPQITKHL